MTTLEMSLAGAITCSDDSCLRELLVLFDFGVVLSVSSSSFSWRFEPESLTYVFGTFGVRSLFSSKIFL